jgi:hypothetical protein
LKPAKDGAKSTSVTCPRQLWTLPLNTVLISAINKIRGN